MKRSVNFSSPAKFAALAAMRSATTETWLAEPSAECDERAKRDIKALYDIGRSDLSIALQVAMSSVSHGKYHQNVGELIYKGFDQGWRTNGIKSFVGPDGSTRQAPSMLWADAMRAIQAASEQA
jgi:hypothetical protein